eukprot:CAMPEP_0183329386 /NCGR_PEP_ID=MMETSP0160_2-20130417/84767_1 /TAXON_ID=2839 ORGANISM="Odontella Sinensis, Strain Grunow 1884" /NCGR_SAMPLE_ID=MMETSP0160_2 /ASSEMBLY_ACC=CAM_ASM_000250 /LENGTH=528 /DNA_ID=CAMNT_0025497577 /DNA_START=57 /DNA_END=1643 /DNA_ORIENTATION=+
MMTSPPAAADAHEAEAHETETEEESETDSDSESESEWDESEDEWDSDEEEDEDDEDLEERLRALADLRALKNLAVHFLHPELPVQTDGTAFGRNYFDRPSAPDREEDDADDEEDNEEERRAVLADAAALKKAAVDHAHPELGVSTSDPTCFGRDYFDRPSAPEREDEETADEAEDVMDDVAMLKRAAYDYLHPEAPVAVDPTCFGRNYFDRPSAKEREDEEDAEEREAILAEAAALRKLAMDYAHPEAPVKAVDPTCFGRNYFNRPSAPEREDDEDAGEREAILAEAAALKKLAVDYAHPERAVEVDPASFGRNYFSRPSAVEQEDEDDAEEREAILAEAAALKKLAVDYAHPERAVQVDPTAFGRSYFGRPSAVEQEDEDDAEEREAILAEAAALKKLAADYAHPERPVEVDPTAFGRNYFDRASAPEQEDEDDAEEREAILAEAAALKKLAADYAHPERPVEVDPTSFGRNYFARPSAPGRQPPSSVARGPVSGAAAIDKPNVKAGDAEREDHFGFDHLREDLRAM